MILFYGEGRLGNQILQYLALTVLSRTGERVLAVGLEDLTSVVDLDGPRLTVLVRRLGLKRLVKYLLLPLLLRPMAKTLRLCNYASESFHYVGAVRGAGGEFRLRRGLLSGVTFVDGGHYQNASYWQDVFPLKSIRLKPELRERARRLIISCTGAAPACAFVHVRRSDYLAHVDYGQHDLGLPLAYYQRAIEQLQARCPGVHLLFVTDDPAWVSDSFAQVEPKTVLCSDAASDFGVMAMCGMGAISNSTFSLAAALLTSSPAVIVAPKYWNGFRIDRWLPPLIECSHPTVFYLTGFAHAR